MFFNPRQQPRLAKGEQLLSKGVKSRLSATRFVVPTPAVQLRGLARHAVPQIASSGAFPAKAKSAAGLPPPVYRPFPQATNAIAAQPNALRVATPGVPATVQQQRLPAMRVGGMPLSRSSVVQPAAAATIAGGIIIAAIAAGARFRKATTWFSLNRSSRRRISWFSKGIQQGIGVADKPASGAVCPACGKKAKAWQLDHINPWRQYVASALDPAVVTWDGTDIWVDINQVRALYNDPQNLWWICSGCNGKKSDYALDRWDASWGSRLTTRGRDLDLATHMDL